MQFMQNFFIIASVVLVFQQSLFAANVVAQQRKNTTVEKGVSWSIWKTTVRKQILNTFAGVQKAHPEFNSLPINSPAEFSFEVARNGNVANIRQRRKSGFDDFDSMSAVSIISLRTRRNYEFSLPRESSYEFVRCKVLLFPRGTVSDLTIDFPLAHEKFIDSTVQVPQEKKPAISPPDVVAF